VILAVFVFYGVNLSFQEFFISRAKFARSISLHPMVVLAAPRC